MISSSAPKHERLRPSVKEYVDSLDLAKARVLEKLFGESPVGFRCRENTEDDWGGCDIRVDFLNTFSKRAQHKERQNEQSSHPRAGKDIGIELLRYYVFKVNPWDYAVVRDGGRDMWRIPGNDGVFAEKCKNGKFKVIRDWDATQVHSDVYVTHPYLANYHLWTMTDQIKRWAQWAGRKFMKIEDESSIVAVAAFSSIVHAHNDISDWKRGLELMVKHDRDTKSLHIVEGETIVATKEARIAKVILYIRPEIIPDEYQVQILD